jgi:hypothetical protein
LARAQRLAANLPLHRATLARLKSLSRANPQEQWEQSLLSELVWGIEQEIVDQGTVYAQEGLAGLLSKVTDALDRARTSVLFPGTRANPREEAIEAIATDPRYGGLRLGYDYGLIPIGPDPASRLWEFALPKSGAIPRRDPKTGLLDVTSDTCVVFVLLPGGTFKMGAQRGDHDGPHFDPEAEEDEGPVHNVTLSPFFISKYETTRLQWLRICGGAGTRHVAASWPTLVEIERWRDCGESSSLRGWVRSRLPTESEWEYACRAGTDTPTYGELEDIAWFERNITKTRWNPIGRKAPNAFGLHDMLGNAGEWCQDWYDPLEYG